MKTTKASQLAAMRYLAAKKPKLYKLVQTKFAPYSSELSWTLNEIFHQKDKEVLFPMHSIRFKLNFRDWD